LNPSKLLFTINVYVNSPDLNDLFQDAGLVASHENHSRAKIELTYLLQQFMPQLLEQATHNVKEWSKA